MSTNFIIDTPICDFVKNYSQKNTVRLHMPGHKGVSFLGCENGDITEISGADALYLADGIIKKSENNAALLFGTADTLYSTEGSSQCICAMLYLACLNNKNSKTVIATRNAHKAFLRGVGLLDLDVRWLYPEDENYSVCKCAFSIKNLEKALKETNPVAVYITSPDYLGNVADIEEIAKITHLYNTLLIVDNAHGAYLKFLPSSKHPIDLGADMCCDSAHKTLPVLTGGAYLHIAKRAENLSPIAKRAMEMFGSTSPSYLILQSLDRCNLYLSSEYKNELFECIKKVNNLRSVLKNKWDFVASDDLLKLTLNTKKYGYDGKELSAILEKNGIICEYADPDYIVMMFSPQNCDEDFVCVEKCLQNIPQKTQIQDTELCFTIPQKALSVREAMFCKGRKIAVENAENCVLASLNVSCPPAVSSIVAGEIITKNDIKILKYYGITEVSVIE